jgi:hypothetical protein
MGAMENTAATGQVAGVYTWVTGHSGRAIAGAAK